MCEPITISSTAAIWLGVGTAVTAAVGTVAAYQQQQAQARFADQQAFAQMSATNRAAEQSSLFAQSQALFNMEQQNSSINIANQRVINDWILSSQQTNLANANTQREFLMAKQQQDQTNLINQNQFLAQLNQSILSELRAETQKEFNRRGLNSDLEAAQERRNQAQAQRAFEAERLMVSSIEAQGSLLASGRSGQSVGLGVLNEGAKYGRDMRMAERNLESAMGDFYSETTNAFLTKAQKDAQAIASILPRPIEPAALPDIPEPVFAEFAPKPVFAPFMTDPGPIQKPIYAAMPTASPRPSALGLVAGLGNAALSGVNTAAAFGGIKAPGGTTPNTGPNVGLIEQYSN